MDQFNDFKNEESHPAGEALHSISGELLDSAEGSDNGKKIDLRDSYETIHLIEQVLTELLPYIASHGGHVELVDVRETVVFIKFSGACVQCPLSFYTVTYGIERHIKIKAPWITRVEVIED